MFESIIDSIFSIDEQDLWKAGAAGFKAFQGSKKSADTSGLNDGMMALGSGNVSATKTRPAESADASSLESEWLSRLNKFSNISNTMVKP